MQVTQSRPSAQILAFPLASRKPASNLGAKAKFAAELAALRGEHPDFDGWYHEAAIAEEDRQRST